MSVTVRPIRRGIIEFTIKGESPLIMKRFAEKAKEQMRAKHAGKKTKDREVRDIEAEAKACTYYTADGHVGMPVIAIKASILQAAHKDLGFPRTMISKAIFVVCNDANGCVPIEFSDMRIREDYVKQQKTTDLRYRPEFRNWSCRISLEIDMDLLNESDVLSLVDRAGFGCGLLEWRAQKGGEFGRYRVDRESEVRFTELGDVE